MEKLFEFILSDNYEVVLLVIAALAATYRLFVVFRFRYTIRSRYENFLSAIALYVVFMFYTFIRFYDFPHPTLTFISRTAFTLMVTSDLAVGHMEVARRNRAKTLINAAKDMGKFQIFVRERDCPEPTETILQFKELEE